MWQEYSRVVLELSRSRLVYKLKGNRGVPGARAEYGSLKGFAGVVLPVSCLGNPDVRKTNAEITPERLGHFVYPSSHIPLFPLPPSLCWARGTREKIGIHSDTFGMSLALQSARYRVKRDFWTVTRWGVTLYEMPQTFRSPLVDITKSLRVGPESSGAVLGKYPPYLDRWKGTIEDDVFLVNDPYGVGGSISHLNDWLVRDDAHSQFHIEVPGSLPTCAMSIFEEGLQIPITKVASKGVWNDSVMELIYRNCRLPEWNRSDTHALVAACALAGRRIKELYTRFGDKPYFAAINELLDRNRKAIAIINVIPDEPVYFEDWIDMTIGAVEGRMHCVEERWGSANGFHWNGSAISILGELLFEPQHLIVVHDPRSIVNDGFHDLVDIFIPEGTLLNPMRPAALSTRTHLLGRVMDLLSGPLGQRFHDGGRFLRFASFRVFRLQGEWAMLYQIGFGGIPARPHGDGMDGHCLWPAMKSVPNELYYPFWTEEYNTDSGDAGLYRGGNAQRILHRFLEEALGVLGGEPGGRYSKILIHHGDGSGRREVLNSKQDHIRVQKDDLLEWLTWGGGGYGDPLKREAKFVALEVHRGLISFEGGKRYGVVVNPDCSVDEAATAALRLKIANRRDVGGAPRQCPGRDGSSGPKAALGGASAGIDDWTATHP
ncbi:hypothetical protein DFH07DRAFT_785330 [Mycena maculata]|uniref:Hydantoinase B/oxoprolinase domain-containing protein n=1 Tax=Mycena maculata TaxID=230809 RepID=A0AAD7HBK5_9AGAR|nr:hypothetical protein DFH07DRAFT_785330 [Mycena maculata]